ncbi:MAG: hypothetical protein A2V70_04505 [Planctomycetes bacterium RBG_13_63_9]|nr:MAG: hypothetical protein A2V70_04505 [Planctomycetes bacterium RBG_13_63_9]
MVDYLACWVWVVTRLRASSGISLRFLWVTRAISRRLSDRRTRAGLPAIKERDWVNRPMSTDPRATTQAEGMLAPGAILTSEPR